MSSKSNYKINVNMLELIDKNHYIYKISLKDKYVYSGHRYNEYQICIQIESNNENYGFIEHKTDLKNIIKTLDTEKNNINNFNSNFKFYFDKSSKFPRYKFRENTEFQRVVKKDKADVIVINNQNLYSNINRISDVVFKSNNCYFYFTYDFGRNYIDKKPYFDAIIKRIFDIQNECNSLKEFDTSSQINFQNSLLTFLKNSIKNNNVDFENFQLVNNSLIQSSYLVSIYDVINTTKLLITDDQLDQYINNELLELTPDYLRQLLSMLKSTDESTVELGLKMITSFNINNYKNLFKLILCHNYRNIYKNKGMTSAIFLQFMDTIDCKKYELKDYYEYSPERLNIITNVINKITTNEEKELLVLYLKEYFENHLKDYFNKIINPYTKQGINISLIDIIFN